MRLDGERDRIVLKKTRNGAWLTDGSWSGSGSQAASKHSRTRESQAFLARGDLTEIQAREELSLTTRDVFYPHWSRRYTSTIVVFTCVGNAPLNGRMGR